MYLVSRTETFAKLFFIVSFTGLFMYVGLAFYTFHNAFSTMSQMGKYQERFNHLKTFIEDDRFEKDLKYILVWLPRKNRDENLLPYEGQAIFVENNCPEINCYVTTKQTILNGDYANFDAIIFNTSLLMQIGGFYELPFRRKNRQKYVFYGIQASHSHPICNIHLNNFFNWTWTYKFYSDIFTPFIEVKDKTGKVVAPSRKVLWTTHSKPLTKSDDNSVSTKSKAVAWVIDECVLVNKRMAYFSKLKRALREFNLTIDVFGCGYKKCPKYGCMEAIQRDYYFYLANEDAVSEDYVTAEVLKGYHHNAVPIVIGGADYSMFLPDTSYINYQFYTEDKLAALLYYTINNPSVYQQYFNWKNYYTIEKVEPFRGYCEICKMLNDKKKFHSFSSYDNFRSWWYSGPLRDKCLPKGAETVKEISTYLKEPARGHV